MNLTLKLSEWLVTLSIFSLISSQSKNIEELLNKDYHKIYDLPEFEEWEHGDVWEGDDFYFTQAFPENSKTSYGFMP
jgi:hypothetical protein